MYRYLSYQQKVKKKVNMRILYNEIWHFKSVKERRDYSTEIILTTGKPSEKQES